VTSRCGHRPITINLLHLLMHPEQLGFELLARIAGTLASLNNKQLILNEFKEVVDEVGALLVRVKSLDKLSPSVTSVLSSLGDIRRWFG